VKLGTVISTLILLISLVVLWRLQQVILVVLASIIFATALNIIARKIQGFGVRRSLAVVLSIVAAAGTAVIFFALLVPPFIEQFNQFIQLFPKILDRLDQWVRAIGDRFPGDLFDGFTLDMASIIQQVQPVVNNLLETTINVFSDTLGVLLNLLLVVILTLMFVADPQWYRRCFIQLFPAFYRRRVNEILNRCEVALTGWLVGILFNMLIIAVTSWVALSFLGVQFALANGLFAGLLTFIPNIGPGLSVIPPMAIALLESPWKSLTVLLLYVIIQQLEGNILTPYIMAQQVSLPPAFTLLAQVFFASFFGFPGLFLALPLTVLILVWVKSVLIEDILNPWDRHDRYTQISPTIPTPKREPPPPLEETHYTNS
jgi:predicted PurR-regulated permease PerM